MSNSSLIFVVCLVLALGGYWFFGTGGADLPLSAAEPIDPAEQEFITLSQRLESISFDVSIFADPRFNVLVNLATPIHPEIVGRIDPFAPLGK